MAPQVSIIILNYQHPEIINICLRSLTITEGVEYEVVVVDNGSRPEVVEELRQHKAEGRIDTLVEEPVNNYFSEGNNIGVRNSNPESEYLLLLNSDVAAIHPQWLQKQIDWMEGKVDPKPAVWNLHPTYAKPGPLDVVSIGWSFDGTVEPSKCRPEGWCCMYRRAVWRDMSPDFPFYNGFEEQVANICRDGHRVGVLCMYAPYVVHAESQSGGARVQSKRVPDIAGWFRGLEIETLDFTLGPNEHQSYMIW